MCLSLGSSALFSCRHRFLSLLFQISRCFYFRVSASYFQGWDTTGAFSEIAPVVSHFEISFSKLYLYFQGWDTTGAFFEIAPVVSHWGNSLSKLYLCFQV